jgi:CHAT domain-containing protein
VLSACETAKGKERPGEGVQGLTWALFAAGVPTSIVSQWQVSDKATADLMTAFYTNLKNKQKKGEALRNAALKLLKKPETKHPYYWAPFVLVGDWN